MVECFVAVISRSTEPTIPWFRDHYCWSLKKSQVTHKDVVLEEGAQWRAVGCGSILYKALFSQPQKFFALESY